MPGVENVAGTELMMEMDLEQEQRRSGKLPSPPHATSLAFRKALERLFFSLFRGAALINALALAIIVAFLLKNGVGVLSLDFFLQAPQDSMTKGGIFPCIVGTFWLCLGSMAFAMPLGVCTSIYLHEYARPGKMLRLIRLCVANLAGVPSVVFGLFGLGLFVTAMKLGVSLAAGWLTLGALCLPVVIGTAEEALRNVPATYREASLALGATKWQTIWRVVLPSALPGILTGSILGVGRAAGETAAIMFTAAVFYTPKMPTSMFSDVMALPYHIYVLATAGTEIEKTRPIQYGTSLVLIALVLGMNLAAILLRAWLQKRQAH